MIDEKIMNNRCDKRKRTGLVFHLPPYKKILLGVLPTAATEIMVWLMENAHRLEQAELDGASVLFSAALLYFILPFVPRSVKKRCI